MNKYQYKVQGVDYEVEIEEVEGNIAKVNVNGIPFEVELQKPINAAKHPTMTRPKVEAPKAAAPTPRPAAPAAAPAQPAAPVGAVTTPRVRIYFGIGCLYSSENMPDSCSLFFSSSYLS